MMGCEILKFVREMNEEVVENAVKEGVEVCSGRAVVGDAGRGLVACGRETDIEADAKEGTEAVLFVSAMGKRAGRFFAFDHDIVDRFSCAVIHDMWSNRLDDGCRCDIKELWP